MSMTSQAAPATAPGADGASAVPPAPSHDEGLRPVIMMAVGGLLTGIVMAAVLLALPSGQSAVSSLQTVAPEQLDDAIVSLGGLASAATVADARQCKAPLAYVTLSAEAGSTASTVRIRS